MPMNRTDLLENLREHWRKNNVPNITDINAHFLRDIITIKQAKNILEIGTANWFSTIHLAIASEKNGWKVTSIDFSPKSYEEAVQNIDMAQLNEGVTLLFWNALVIIPTLKETYDFVFIDGMMRQTVDFLWWVWNKVEKWGIIIIDDVIKYRKKMIWLDDFLKKYHIDYNILPLDGDDGIMMIIKNNNEYINYTVKI